MNRWRTGLVRGLLLVLVVVLAACGEVPGASGGSGDFSGELVAQQVAVAADPGGALRWDRPSYEAVAGDSTFVVKNASPVGHQFSIEGNGVSYKSPSFGANTTNTYTVKGLSVGEYQIVCNYPGHKVAGMVSKLIVR